MQYTAMLKTWLCFFVLLRRFSNTLSDVANDEDSLKMPPYKVARAGHYPMVYDRVTGVPWPCDPFGDSPKDKDAEKDPSFIKLSKCPEEPKIKKTKKIKRNIRQHALIWKYWKSLL